MTNEERLKEVPLEFIVWASDHFVDLDYVKDWGDWWSCWNDGYITGKREQVLPWLSDNKEDKK